MKGPVTKAELGSQFHIESAAISTEEIGNPAYPPARRKLAEYGIDCTGKTAHQFICAAFRMIKARPSKATGAGCIPQTLFCVDCKFVHLWFLYLNILQKARCIAIDWLTSLALAFSFADRKQKKEQKKREEEITSYWNEIANAIFYLRLLLNEMCYLQRYPIDKQQSDNLKELILLFPMAEILSLQGFVGPVQEQYLRNHINIHQPRYNLKQFLTASIDWESIYPEWNALCGLSENHCGEIWHTLIEIICRLRAPERSQEVGKHLSTILYHFWLLDHSDMEPARIRCQNIFSNFNMHSDRDQDLPYLHAVMFLQRVLSEKYGGELPDYLPKLVSDQPYPMDGTEGFLFEARRQDDFDFCGTFAVRKTDEPHNCDLVWEISPMGGPPTVLFSE